MSRVLVLAGEVSGDHHAAAAVRALRARRPEVEFVGLGGPELAAEGVELLEGLDRLAVMGFAEVVRHLPFFWRLGRRVEAEMEAGVELVIAVDYPGFNMRMAKAARERGIPVLWYIAPQVWAWKAHRAAQLARDATEIAVILPFEEEIFIAEGGRATYVGHPLVEQLPGHVDEPALRAALGVGEAPLIALLPGSRRQELDRHLEIFLQAAARVRERRPEARIVVAGAPGVELEGLRDAVRGSDVDGADEVVLTDRTRELLRVARVALVKSGTSTLEAALADVPFVMAYRTSPLTWFVAKRVVRVDHIALANLVAGDRIVPEYIQWDATPEALAEALDALWSEDAPARREMRAGLAEIRARLGGPGASDRVAAIADRLLAGQAAGRAGEGP